MVKSYADDKIQQTISFYLGLLELQVFFFLRKYFLILYLESKFGDYGHNAKHYILLTSLEFKEMYYTFTTISRQL